MSKNIKVKICLAILLLLTTKVVFAQSINSNEILINVSPQNPEPGQQINLSTQSLSLDLTKAKITWYLNNAEQKTGVGLKNFSLIAGEAGKTMAISVLAENPITKQPAVANVSITPAGVDLIFEAITYTPPFYQGKTLNVNQADIMVVAFPELFDSVGRKYNTSELLFNWKKDGAIASESSGLGKNYFSFSGSVPPRDAEVSVTVTAPKQGITATKNISIKRYQPEIIFYEFSPIYGVLYNRAINDKVSLKKDEFSIYSTPFFYSAGYPLSNNLNYSWSINGKGASNQDYNNIFSVRQEEKGSGQAQISLKISNLSRIFQYKTDSLQIDFQKE